MTEDKLFKFYSQGRLIHKVATLKGVKKYFIEGYASTVDEDLAGEVINDAAQESMLRQFRNRNITIDVEHEEWYDEDGKQLDKPKAQMIPVAKVIAAKKDSKGTWVKAELNTNIERFKEIWGSIKGGFLNAFSIGFFPIAKMGNVISDLNIVNLTVTGTPVNPGATFTPVLKSAVAYLKSIEKENDNKMAELKADVPVETPVEAPVETPVAKPVETPVADPAPVVEPAPVAPAPVAVQPVAPEPATPEVAPVTPASAVEVKPEPVAPVVPKVEGKPEDIGDMIERVLATKLKEMEVKIVADAKVAQDNIDASNKEASAKTVSPLGMIKAFQKRKSDLGVAPSLKALVEDTPKVEEKILKQKTLTPLQMV